MSRDPVDRIVSKSSPFGVMDPPAPGAPAALVAPRRLVASGPAPSARPRRLVGPAPSARRPRRLVCPAPPLGAPGPPLLGQSTSLDKVRDTSRTGRLAAHVTR